MPVMDTSLLVSLHTYIFANLFPYVGYMVQGIGVAKNRDEAGHYAGRVASSFMLGRVLTCYHWGKFSDACGRTLGLQVALVAAALLSFGLGLSRSFAQAVLPLLLGSLNCLRGSCRTMISEICGRDHEVAGMGLGLELGSCPVPTPYLSLPSSLHYRYPYLLPNLVGAVFALLALPLVWFLLPETGSS
ncbi:unnamed protein product, partial [Discosporangium mesarthrocarpum]